MIKNIIIIGAGDAGKMLAKEILYSKKNKDYNILCFLDDDENKKEMLTLRRAVSEGCTANKILTLKEKIMNIFLKAVQRINPSHPDEPKKWYLVQYTTKMVDESEVARP